MGFGPWLYGFTSIWLFSNQQVFQNYVPRIGGDVLIPSSGHTVKEVFTTLTPSAVFVTLILSFIALKLFDKSTFLRKAFFSIVSPSKVSLLTSTDLDGN